MRYFFLLVAIASDDLELDGHTSKSQCSQVVPVNQADGIPINAILLAMACWSREA